jgi:phosphoglucomutase/phosphomannomutase
MPESVNPERVSQAVAAVDSAQSSGSITSSGAANLKRWLTESQYSGYVPRILQLIEAKDFKTLDTLFWEVIDFGTGGRRGLMGPFGSATINERTIAESAHGLAVYAKQQQPVKQLTAVVACDTRNRSDEFARLTATTFAANGLQVYFFEKYRSTPELSFAVRHLKCDVGVMITASHNPPSDNGFKAYWSSGGQILAPHDKAIIKCVYDSKVIPTIDFDAAVREGKIEIVGDAVDRAYIDAVVAMSLSREREMPAIFSPLHGVGETSAYRTLQQAGFKGVKIFEPNRKPDGNFTNVPDQLPNPERTEVFAPMIAEARKTGIKLILASDPDADRLGVAVSRDGNEFEHLTGNRIGTLLADYILRKRAAAKTLSPAHFVVETLVTTPLIAAIAKSHHVRAIDNLLVGFKYIGETMDREGPDKFVFGAEESLGYLAGTYARDKDASIAAMYLMELAAELNKEGKSLLDRLDELFVEHGYFTEGQRSEVCKGPQGKQQIIYLMKTFREKPPTQLGGIALARVRDYGRNEIRSLPANTKSEALPEPKGDLLFFESAKGETEFSIAVRPSGTEPKIKFYFFVNSGGAASKNLADTKTLCDQTMKTIQDSLSKWVQTVLATAESAG